MKKIVFLLAAMFISAMSFAQVSFWGTRIYSHWNEETQRYTEQKDTVVDVDWLLKYNQIDSFIIADSRFSATDKVLRIYKDNYTTEITFYSNYTNEYAQYGTYESKYTLDSIVWVPYPVIGIDGITWQYKDHLYKDTIVLPLRDSRHYNVPNDEYYMAFMPQYSVRPIPEYATFTNYSFEVENKNICDIKDISYHYSESGLGMPKYGFRYNIYPYAEGTTDVNVTIDGVSKKFTIVIAPKEGLPERTEETDQLFNKIYSRMIETGDCHPAGCGDLEALDEGTSSLTHMLSALNDMSSDQVYWIWGDVGIDQIRNNTWTPDNILINALFHRLYFNIYLCNAYLNREDATDPVRLAEVRFIRAYLYYQLLDLFGNVPIITNNADFYTAPQASRAQLYDFVVSELLEAEQSLASQKPDYYRVDKTAAWLLLSRVYLNSGVYAGRNDYSLAAQYAYKVLQSNYTLCSEYRRLFMGDNDTNGTQTEVIWALRQVGSEQSSYGGSMYFVVVFADGTENIGINTSWACANTRYQLLDLFSARNTTTTYTETIVNAGDDRALFSKTSYSWNYNTTGRTIHKWTNERTDEQAGTDSQWPDTDIPLFRLAEAYLNYAEAVLRGGAVQGDLSALDAVNAIRNRAHAHTLSEINLQTILDERGREFYAEGMRRPDLIRFNKYGGNTGYQWQYKGRSNNGTNFPAYMNLFPIPQDIRQKNPALIQNEGYTE